MNETLQITFLILNAAVNFGMAVFIYTRNPKSPINVSFACFNFFLSAWAISIILYLVSASEITSLYFLKTAYISAIWIGASYYFFSVNFPNIVSNWNRFIVPILIPSIILSGLILLPNFLTKNLISNGLGKATQLGVPEYWSFTILFSFFFVGGLIRSWIKYKHVSGIARMQLLYVVLSVSVAGIFGMFLNLVLPSIFLHNFSLIWLGPLFTTIIAISIMYAIIAHRLFDIRVIIKRTVVFAGLSAFVLGTYALIVFAAATLVGGAGSAALASQQLIPNLVAALGIALGFEPLRKWLTVRTDKWLFKGEYTPQAVLQELAETLANVVDLGEAVEEMMEIVTKAMRLTKSAAFLVQPGDKQDEFELKQLVTVGYTRKEGMQQIAPKDSLLQYFLHTNVADTKYQPVVAEELGRQLEEGGLKGERKHLTEDFHARLQNLGGAVALPLFIRRQQPIPTPPGSPPRFREVEIFIGVLILGEKKSGDAFTDQDLNLLAIVAAQTAGAVEKSRLFEEDQLKSEFVSIASHELLTPTAAMEGYLSMILEEGMGKVDKQARGYLDTVYKESKRLASLVKDLLNVSRIERGKIVVHPAPLDLHESITQVLASLKFRAEERKIALKFEEAKLPKVMADGEKLTEVLVNLIGNAIKYTPEGGQAVISTETRNGQVLVHIKDNGIGMKPEDIQHLFTKFFRASNSDQTNQGGTGLGLYITKNIIELMGGTIGVESEVNKGSTFTFSLPVAK